MIIAQGNGHTPYHVPVSLNNYCGATDLRCKKCSDGHEVIILKKVMITTH